MGQNKTWNEREWNPSLKKKKKRIPTGNITWARNYQILNTRDFHKGVKVIECFTVVSKLILAKLGGGGVPMAPKVSSTLNNSPSHLMWTVECVDKENFDLNTLSYLLEEK